MVAITVQNHSGAEVHTITVGNRIILGRND